MMRYYQFSQFGLEHLERKTAEVPEPGPGEVRVDLEALSLNFRDVLVVRGHYNPRLDLPATPISDGAGVVSAVGPGVADVAVGDRVMSHFIAGWQDGPYRGEYLGTTLGTPGPGLAAEQVVLPAGATVPMPEGMDFAQAATLPIAALTAWSALVTEGEVKAGQTVLTLGTGGVSIFALQLGKALGARVLITSSSDAKLARARELGADETTNYAEHADWHEQVLQHTGGRGADLVVENGGAATLGTSLRAVSPGGRIAMLGALTGLKSAIDISPILMKRVRVAGIMVDSRAALLDLVRFLGEHAIDPVIDTRFRFDDLGAAFQHMAEGKHFGKIVVDV